MIINKWDSDVLNELKLAIERLEFKERDVLVVKGQFSRSEAEMIAENLRRLLYDTGMIVPLLVCPKDIDLYQMSENEMNRAGWLKIDRQVGQILSRAAESDESEKEVES